MRRDDVRFAAAARDDGLRKISKFTWRAGAAGVVFSALIAAAFGHNVATQQAPTVHGGTSGAGSTTGGSTGGTGSTTGGTGGTGTSTGGTGTSTGGAGGAGSTTGGTGSTTGGTGGGQGTIVVPAQPPAPASGAGQVTSGAT